MRRSTAHAGLLLVLASHATAQSAELKLLPEGYRPTSVDINGIAAGVGPGGVFWDFVYILGAAPGATAAWNGNYFVSSIIDGNGFLTAGQYLGPWILFGGIAPPGPNKKLSEGTAVSINQSYSAGNAWIDAGTRTVPFVRTTATGDMVGLNSTVPGKSAGATSVTEKAHVAGWQENADGFIQGAAWLKGQQVLFVDDLGGRCGRAHSMRYVEKTPITTHAAVVGESASTGEAWYWNETDGLTRIPRLPDLDIGSAVGMTFFSEVFGSCRNAAGTEFAPFVWDAVNGTRTFEEYLEPYSPTIPDGFEFLEVTAVAELGQAFAGTGMFEGQVVGWSLDLMCQSDHYADCDCDGQLNINDFICFQTAFAIGSPYADCDGDGFLTIDDYICFQTCYAVC